MFLLGPIAVNTWEILKTMSGKVMVRCTGAMETYTKANGTMGPKLNKFHNPQT